MVRVERHAQPFAFVVIGAVICFGVFLMLERWRGATTARESMCTCTPNLGIGRRLKGR